MAMVPMSSYDFSCYVDHVKIEIYSQFTLAKFRWFLALIWQIRNEIKIRKVQGRETFFLDMMT